MLHTITPHHIHLHRRLGDTRLQRWLWRYAIGQSAQALHDAQHPASPSTTTHPATSHNTTPPNTPTLPQYAIQLAHTLNQRNARLITILDPEYPPSLRALDTDAPPFLYIIGDPARLTAPSIAIIGTRHPSRHGRAAARAIATAATDHNYTIVSGNAPGIDATAHASALQANGTTLIFPPAPLDQYAPTFTIPTNTPPHAITIASPFPPGTPIQPWNFLARNTLVAAQCCSAYIAETGTRGGTVDTITKLRKLHRPIFATQLPPDTRFHKAHTLLQASGATLVDTTAPTQQWLPQLLDASHPTLRYPTKPVPILDDFFPEDLPT